MPVSPEACAREVLDVIPLVMRAIRSDMRRHRGSGLSVPHFRVLAYLSANTGASLSAVAEHLGLRLPSMSTLVEGMVARGLVVRSQSAVDRRRVTLELTTPGQAALEAARQATLALLTQRLSTLSDQDRGQVIQGLAALRGIFASVSAPAAQE